MKDFPNSIQSNLTFIIGYSHVKMLEADITVEVFLNNIQGLIKQSSK